MPSRSARRSLVLFKEPARIESTVCPFRALLAISLYVGLALPHACTAQIDIEAAPIAYSATADNNRVTQLLDAIERGEVTLGYDRRTGYLNSLLKALEISITSQTLVFSKTSMQVSHISPQKPRAIYFNDDTYVGWVQGSSLMEVSTNDPKLGAAFYSVRMWPSKPRIKRELYTCLACHTSAMTRGVPGHTVRSVTPRADGTIDAQSVSFVTDHTSPFSERWGGWYVTGHAGAMKHMGNAWLRGSQLVADGERNRSKLQFEFHTKDWLTPYSDIVALMVLEHQTQMHNRFTAADFTVRKSVYDHQQMLQQPEGVDIELSKQELEFSIQQVSKSVVDYLLFVNEASLTSPVRSSTEFARHFSARGPADSRGRSLRDFELNSRMFQFPCSYLIDSPAFESLHPKLRETIYRQLWEILSGKNQSSRYAHLRAETRSAIVEILSETKRELPDYWRAPQRDQG